VTIGRHSAHVACALFLALSAVTVGCQPPIEPGYGPGTTTPVGTTTPPSGFAVPDTSETLLPEVPIADVAVVETPVVETPVEPDVSEEAVEVSVEPEPAETVAPRTLGNLVPIDLKLPAPAFSGTPKVLTEPNVELPRGKPRAPFFAPEGTVNLAARKRVMCSDPAPSCGEVDVVTDGNKEASDFGYLEMRPGSQWVQIDLDQRSTVYAIVVWHSHADTRVYRDVIIQISDDPDFVNAVTLFNNDYDNTSGMGIGQGMGYVETSEGKLIDARGHEGRYVRLYSNGNHVDPKNHYTEVEIFGRPIQ